VLYVLTADKLDGQRFEVLFAATFHPDNGRPGRPETSALPVSLDLTSRRAASSTSREETEGAGRDAGWRSEIQQEDGA
jgi:hypothetical protein